MSNPWQSAAVFDMLRFFLLLFGVFIFHRRFLTAQEVKHLIRELTYCHIENMDAGFELEFDGEELWHVDPSNFTAKQRLPEFNAEWTLNRTLPSEAHYSIGTCLYNVPRCVAGENNPPESIVAPSAVLYTKRDLKVGVENTLICLVTNFHPPPVIISWTKNGEPVSQQDISETQYYTNMDFSFRVFSYLTFSPEQGDVYSCSVRHRGLSDDITRLYEVELPEDSEDVETAVLVVGILVGFVGLVAGIVFIVMSKLELPTV